MDPSDNSRTTVIDAGARYGMHPSWRGFKGELYYLAFEPDATEADRLRRHNAAAGFEVIEAALDCADRERPFHLLKHRGLSSFLKPDLNSECFRRLKPGQAEIEKIVKLNTRTVDSLMAERKIHVDFMKVDTEGTEQDVIAGAERQIADSVLGIRSSCNFQRCFYGQALFSESHDYLVARDFTLLNLDYAGFGYPRLGLFRKPDPIEPENLRYGTLVAADGVWTRRPEWIANRYASKGNAAHDAAMLKLAAFCMLNNAPDVGIDSLREHVVAAGRPLCRELEATRLFKGLRLDIAQFLGRWRTVPDEQWERVRSIFSDIYGTPLQGGSEFYPQVQAMTAEFGTS